MNPEASSSSVCKCPHHRVMPIALILIGVIFLCQAFGWLSPTTVNYIWPVLLIIGAGSKLGGCKCCAK